MQDFRNATFLCVCKTLNYTHAARELSITQPAVSQHIAYLEKEYGAKLFEYKNKKLALTPEGELLRDAFTVIDHDERVLKERVAALSAGKRTLNLGVTLTAGEYVLAEPLARYLVTDPDLQVRVVSTDTERLLSLMHQGVIDCALVEGFFDKRAYGWEVFCTEELVAVCSPDHRAASSALNLDDVLEEHLIVRERGSGTRAVLEHELEAHNLSIERFARVTEVSNLNIIKTLVAHTYGIAFLYRAAVSRELAQGSLVELPLSGPKIVHDMTFIWLKDSLFDAEYRTLVAQLAAIGRARSGI